jgi:hypothetical protein
VGRLEIDGLFSVALVHRIDNCKSDQLRMPVPGSKNVKAGSH